MPVENLLLPEAAALPALVVVRLPSGLTHFVVVWRVHGDWVQVMDPGARAALVRGARASCATSTCTRMAVPAEAFRDWAGQRRVHRDRWRAGCARWGCRRPRALIDARARAIRAGGASPRWTAPSARSRSWRGGRGSRGREARRLVAALPRRRRRRATALVGRRDRWIARRAARATTAASRSRCAARCCCAWRGEAARRRRARGAARSSCGRRSTSRAVRARRELLWRLLRGRPRGAGAALAAGVALAAAGGGVRGGAVPRASSTSGAGCSCSAASLAAVALLVLVAAGARAAAGWRSAAAPARRLEERLRAIFHAQDPAPRRSLLSEPPGLGHGRARAPGAQAAQAAHAGGRHRCARRMRDRGRRRRHRLAGPARRRAGASRWRRRCWHAAGGRSRAGRGARPAHAQPRRRAGPLLPRRAAGAGGGADPRRRAGAGARAPAIGCASGCARPRGVVRAALAAEAVQALVGFGLATLAAGRHSSRARARTTRARALLLVYWALALPVLGDELALHVQQVPAQRSLTLRLLEPLGAPEERDDGDVGARRRRPRAGRRGDAGVDRHAAMCASSRRGTRSCDVGALAIAPGEHVAIVGAVGRRQVEPGRAAAGLAPARGGRGPVDGAPLGAARAGGAAAADGRGSIRRSICGTARCADNLRFGLARRPADVAAAIERGGPGRRWCAGCPTGCRHAARRGGRRCCRAARGSGCGFGRGVLRPRPALVILDEPFRGLAREQRRGAAGARAAALVATRRCCA